MVLTKYVSHLPLKQSSTLRPYRSAIISGNATDCSKIVEKEMETERKLFIDQYCRIHTYPLQYTLHAQSVRILTYLVTDTMTFLFGS